MPGLIATTRGSFWIVRGEQAKRRFVCNRQIDSYRIEKRGVLYWAFVSDPETGNYPRPGDIDDIRLRFNPKGRT